MIGNKGLRYSGFLTKYVKAGYPEPIKINMWDSLSESNNSQNNNQVSDLTKSFLFQLANGHDGKLGSYVNKLPSKNYGIISFASNRFKMLFWCFFASAICFVLYKISGVSGTGIMQHLPDWCNVASSWFKLLSPILILASAIVDNIDETESFPSHAQARRMRKAFEEGKLNYDTVTEIMAEVKPNQVEKLKIPMNDIRKYVPKYFTPQQISELAIKLFKQNYDRQHNRDAR